MSQTHVVFGVWVSFGGLLIAEAQSGDSAGTLSLQTATLVASIAHLGRMLGCVASAPLTDRLGVLRVIQLSVPLNLLAWPMMTLGGRSMMVAGAVMAGAFVGLNASGGRLYIAEVTSNRTRGTLCYLPGVAIGLSLLVNFSVSAAIPWRYATLLCGCTPSVVHFLAFTTRWLLSRGGREKEAQRAIAFYRGKRADVAMETKHILQVLRGRPTPNILQQARLIFTDWDVAKPCLLLLVQFFFDSFCGGIVLTQYAPGLFRMAVRSLAPAQCTQLLAALQVAAAVVMSMTPTIYGATLSFAAHLLAESQSSDATAQLTLRDATMVAAISNLGRMFACVASASLTDRLGVLRVIQLSVPFNLLPGR
ncbi:sugar transporter ERD6-like [Pollicipes pollicipes]|uniref:sugar transporter ERD6-like n=1 Tax=Pollicipes pollicipes TaxID=41117 RepID=UPI001885952B|nr:sugar transporter ERD6-like [Pollicipes pollicipes]